MDRRSLTIGMCVLALGVTTLAGQTPPAAPATPPSGPPPDNARLAREVGEVVRAWNETGWFHGAVLIGRGEAVVYSDAGGWAHPAYNVRNTVETSFNIGGITQLFTVATILRYQEQGKLKVDDTIGRFMPDWPEPVKAITIKQLLTGPSGLKDVTQIPEFVKSVATPRSSKELVELIIKEPVAQPPQGRSTNSNGHVLAALIEKIAGKPYMDALRSEILDPLGLSRTMHDSASAVVPNRSVPFGRRGYETVLSAPFDMSNALGVANLRSTVRDVFTFVRALVNGKIISAASLAEMTTNYAPRPANAAPNALIPGSGYAWTLTPGPEPAWQLTTGIAGYAPSLTYVPSTAETILVLANGSGGEVGAISRAVRNIMTGQPGYRPSKRKATAARAADLAAIAGTWQVGAISTIIGGKRVPQELTARVDGDRLFVTVVQNGLELEWFSDGPRRFFNPTIDQVIVLPEDSSKPITYSLFDNTQDLKRVGS